MPEWMNYVYLAAWGFSILAHIVTIIFWVTVLVPTYRALKRAADEYVTYR